MAGVNRRDLIKASLLGGVAAATGSAIAADGGAAPSLAPASPSAGSDLPFEFNEATFSQLQALMIAGKQTSQSLTAAYLKRIEALNPKLHAVLAVNPDALKEAAALDAERKAKGARGPLHGIPLLVKDNLETVGPMGTTAGSLALEGVAVPNDSFVVARLKLAGAVLLGKANLSEWANLRSSRSSSGWSAKGGLCRNPYALDRSALGSSSGSGAGTAANLCAGSIGTETNGSILCPSSVHALVGLKPTVGLISRAGIVPISPSQDTAGPICRTVTDAAVLLTAIAGADKDDPATTVKGRPEPLDYTQSLKKDALKGVKLGVLRKQVGNNDHLQKVFAAALEVLKGLGAELVDNLELPESPQKAQLDLLLYEQKAALKTYLETRRPASPHKNLADLIAFNVAHADQEMPWFSQELFDRSNAKGPLTDPDYLKAKKACLEASRTKGIDALLKKHKVDALISSAMGPAWNIDLANGDGGFDGYGGDHAAMAGYPSLTVPMGDLFGLPVGLCFVSTAWTEAKLLSYAFAYEQAAPMRKPPKLLPSSPPLT